jgi:type III secretion protein V
MSGRKPDSLSRTIGHRLELLPESHFIYMRFRAGTGLAFALLMPCSCPAHAHRTEVCQPMKTSPSNLQRLFSFLAQSEALPSLVILSTAAMLIVPVPVWAIDLLLSVNLAFAISLLLMAVRVGGALKVSSLPTLLLIATLFRLALNVSTTRLILASGDAGDVVRAFGNFASGGNPLVGGVVFLIVTVVQFIVIAKGAERVAEVGARFSLDAMPGKQMSIDADLRAGVLDPAQARAKRLELERLSQFHGAMDGAMKFVKGDAVAGMLITLVNLLGGLLVGCLQQGLSPADAVQRYTLLTIGDGLASQIPALLVSVAAGLVVTRVRAERADHGLGRQAAQQLGAHPEVLLFAGAALACIGLAPGMPAFVLCGLGGGLSGLGGLLARRQRLQAVACADVERPEGALVLRLPAGTELGGDEAALLQGLRDRVALDLGLQLPALHMRPDGPNGRWIMEIDQLPVASGRRDPGPWTAGQASDSLDAIETGLRRVASRFVGVQETQDLLNQLERTQPALVREVVPRLVPPVLLAEILARLVEEQVPVRDLRAILSCLAEWARSEADPMLLAERVRENLGPVISHRVAPDGQLPAWLLDPQLEELIQGALETGSGPASLALSPQDAEAVLAGLTACLGEGTSDEAVVLCRAGIRRPFWKLVSQVRPGLRVLSFMELMPSLEIRPLGRIGLGTPAAQLGAGR